jgi:hypothetical protein
MGVSFGEPPFNALQRGERRCAGLISRIGFWEIWASFWMQARGIFMNSAEGMLVVLWTWTVRGSRLARLLRYHHGGSGAECGSWTEVAPEPGLERSVWIPEDFWGLLAAGWRERRSSWTICIILICVPQDTGLGSGKDIGFGIGTIWVQIPVLPLPSFLTLVMFLIS